MNSTTNSSQYGSIKEIKNGYTTDEKVIIGITMTMISMMTIFGNVSIIYVYIKVKTLQTTRNVLLISLACSDMIVGLIPINLYTVYLLLDYWPFGRVVCYFWLVIDHWSFTASNFTLLAIAFDRFLATGFPIWHRARFSKKYVIRVIRIIWFAAFLIWSPAILIYPQSSLTPVPNNQCIILFYLESANITITIATLSYFLPVLSMVVVYAYVCYVILFRQRNTVVPLSNSAPQQNLNTEDLNKNTRKIVSELSSEVIEEQNNTIQNNGEHSRKMKEIIVENIVGNVESTEHHRDSHISYSLPNLEKQQQIRSSNKKVRSGILFLLLVSLAFILSWMSYHTMIILLSLKHTSMPENLWKFCYIIGWINSTINPCCYAFYNKKFRRGFKQLFFKRN